MNDPSFEQTMAMSSIAGGVASGIVNRSMVGTGRKICEGVCGALFGIFVGPALADYIGADQSHLRMAVGFGCGAVGAVAMTLAMDYANGSSFKEWIAARIGLPLPPGQVTATITSVQSPPAQQPPAVTVTTVTTTNPEAPKQ